MRGYRDALEDNGLPVDYSLIYGKNFQDLDAAFCRSLVKDRKLDAIVCKMDYYAALIGRHLMEMGLKIGQDVMLTGFDDEPFSSLLPVPLTSIHFPAEPFAQVCYEHLIAQMANPLVPIPGQTLIDVQLVVRESTGAAVELAPATAGV
jgi:LacI family transcriptional regulator